MLARWNPWQELLDIEREMRDLTRRFVGSDPFTPRARGNGGAWAPAVDVFTREGDLVVRADLPGVDPEKDVEISVQDGVLTIRGERRREEKVQREDFYRFESSYGSFIRTVPLPQGAQEDRIRASYDSGILEVVVPAAAELPAAKRIPVTMGEGRKAITTEGEKKK